MFYSCCVPICTSMQLCIILVQFLLIVSFATFLSELYIVKLLLTGEVCSIFYIQEYKDIWLKRAQQLHHIRDRPDQFTVLVREIPICFEHKAHGCSVDHFFSKCYPHSYQSYQILYDSRELERLLVRKLTTNFLTEFV